MFQVDPGPGSPADLSNQTRQRDPAIGFWRHATVDRLGISYSARTRVDIESQPLMSLIRDPGRSIIDLLDGGGNTVQHFHWPGRIGSL